MSKMAAAMFPTLIPYLLHAATEAKWPQTLLFFIILYMPHAVK
jgi:hypothetical protein